ncbi:MAG: LysR substrate-binding domain-containing protein [Gammaproteobacteria bacterium]
MVHLPSIQTLRAFEAAARLQSYTAAAEELGVTHGAISHRIRALERRVGMTLFHRTGRAMEPAREAVTLLAQVREALGALQRALPDRSRSTPDRLVVSVHPSLATRWLIPRIGRFLDANPDLGVEIRSTADLGSFLTHGIDVSLRYGTGDWPHSTGERLAGEILFPVCTPAYRDQHRLVQPGDLARCTLLRHAWQPWSPWLRAARLRIREPVGKLSLSDTGLLLEAALAGRGVALTRSLFAIEELRSGRLVRPFELAVPDSYGYYLTWHAGTVLSREGSAFRDWLQRELVTEPVAGAGAGRARRRRGTARARK